MKHITLIDLNNFSYYPTMAVGFLARYIRDAGFDLTVMVPLSDGIKSRKKEKVEGSIDYYKSRFIHSDKMLPRMTINYLKKVSVVRETYNGKQKVFDYVKSQLNYETDLVLISSYTENYSICNKIGQHLASKNIPVIIGGPGFNEPKSVHKFLEIPSVKHVVGAEVDSFLGDMLKDFFANKDITHFPGVYTSKTTIVPTNYVYKELDELPLPDYREFPWEKYPFKVIPYMAGRGCSWGKCNFCTDVMYVNGRTFRSQSSKKILADLKQLTTEVNTNIINFVDIKLNSHVGVWNDLIENLPKIVENPKWFGSVHVDKRTRNGLDLDTLKKAKAAGLTRISFGLETASQRLLDHMKKGTTVERLEQFVNDVHTAGISLRATMFLGYIGENEMDLKDTYEFLERNRECFDRIRVARFQIFEMSPLYNELDEEVRSKIYDNRLTPTNKGRQYNHYKTRILKICNQINSKELNSDATKYDGVM